MLHSSTNPFLWNIDDQHYHGGYHGLNNINKTSTTYPQQPDNQQTTDHQQHQTKEHNQHYLNEDAQAHPQSNRSVSETNDNLNMSKNNRIIDDEVAVAGLKKPHNGSKSVSPPSSAVNGPLNHSPENTPTQIESTANSNFSISYNRDNNTNNTNNNANNNSNNINNNNNNNYCNDKMSPMDLSGSSGSSAAVEPTAINETLSHLSGVLSQLKALERR